MCVKQEEDGDMCKWRTYWCVLENLQIGCWSSSSDHEVAEPLRAIPVNKVSLVAFLNPFVHLLSDFCSQHSIIQFYL